MDTLHRNDVLNARIADSSLSKEFKLMAKLNGFQTFGDILELGVEELPFVQLGNYRIQLELLDFLDRSDLLHLVD